MPELRKIGKYEVLEKIGEGGFAVVHKGRDPFIKRQVAIKTCASTDHALRSRFVREAEIAGQLQHPNIVTVFDFGLQGSVPYLVQEYLPGEDLDRLIRRRVALSVPRRVDILLQVAQGLEYAHSRGVIHRDIKPGNIRILENERVKIMDFGIAKLASAEIQLTQKGMTMGTAGYLAPEQLRGDPVDARCDIFSFGVLAYELFAYRRPFEARTFHHLVEEILQREPDRLEQLAPDCPPPLAALVHRCLEKDANRRHEGFDGIVAELEALATLVREQERSTGEARTVVLEARESTPSTPPPAPVPPAAEAPATAPTAPVGMPQATAEPAADEPLRTVMAPAPPREPLRTAAVAAVPPGQTTAGEPVSADATQPVTPIAAAEAERLRAAWAAKAQPAVSTPAAAPDPDDTAVALRSAPARPEPVPSPPGVPVDAAAEDEDADAARTVIRPTLAAAAASAAVSPEFAEEAQRISGLVAEGKLENAIEELEETLQRLRGTGEHHPPAVDAPSPAPPPAGPDGAATVILPAAHPTEPATPAPPPIPAVSQVPAAPQPPSTAGTPSTVPPSASAGPSTRAAAGRTGPRRLLIITAAAMALLVLAFTVWWTAGGDHQPEAPAAAPPAAPAPPPVPAAAATGKLLVDARPWGEIVRLVDGAGAELPLPPQGTTPLVLELGAGTYSIELRSPEESTPQVCTVEVRGGATAVCRVELVVLAPEDYLRETGWWR